jgi:hypothetical protein
MRVYFAILKEERGGLVIVEGREDSGRQKRVSKKKSKIVENLLINKPIDIVLLKKQRNVLVDDLDRWTEEDHGKDDKELYDGLINFLDHVLDVAEAANLKRPTKHRFG